MISMIQIINLSHIIFIKGICACQKSKKMEGQSFSNKFTKRNLRRKADKDIFLASAKPTRPKTNILAQ